MLTVTTSITATPTVRKIRRASPTPMRTSTTR